tara:strand:- start:951 stop:1598 length:648 start_codon:yes stop_codon:yes gene_type:complete
MEETTKRKGRLTLEGIGVSADFNSGLQGSKIYTSAHISNQKPSETEWFRVLHQSWPETPDGVLVKMRVGVKDVEYLVFGSEQFKARVKDDFKKIRRVHLVYYTTSQGRMGIWPISIPQNERAQKNNWIVSAQQLVESGRSKWTKCVSNQGIGAYEMFVARPQDQEQFGEAKFELDFLDCLEKAYGDDILMEEEYDDNPYVQQQIGTQVGITLAGN